MLGQVKQMDSPPGHKLVALISGIVVVAMALGVSIVVGSDEIVALYIVGGFAIFLFAFINTDFALGILILSMLLSPEFAVGGAGGAGQMAQRSVVIRIDDLILAIILFSWFVKTAVNKELGIFVKTPLNKPIFAYILLSLFATIVGIFLGYVRPLIGILYNVKYFQYFMIYFMVSSHIKDLKTFKRYMFFIVLTAVIVGIYALWQIPSGVRVSAPFEGEGGEANTLGGYLVLIMAMVGGLLTEETKIKNMVGYAGIIFILFIPFLYTLSRSSWIAMLPVLYIFVRFSPKRKEIVRILLPILIVTPLFLPDSVIERFTYTFDTANMARSDVVEIGETALDPSTSSRIESWSSTLVQWTKNPLFGMGVTGAGFKDAQYFRVLVETGIVGFTAFIWMLVSINRVIKERMAILDHNRFPQYFGLSLGLLAGYWGLLIHAIGANTFIIVRIMEPFWFLTGLVVVLPEIIKNEMGDDIFDKKVEKKVYGYFSTLES